jgi:hypothetical protein
MAFPRSTDRVSTWSSSWLLCWHALSGVSWSRAAAARSQSLCNFLSSLLSFRNEDSSGGGDDFGYYLAMSTGLLEYTRPPKHTTGKGHLMWKVWVAGQNSFKRWMRFFTSFFFFSIALLNHDGWDLS